MEVISRSFRPELGWRGGGAGRRGITAETALRLARYFRTDAQSWMNLQDRYELALAEREVGEALAAILPRDVA